MRRLGACFAVLALASCTENGSSSHHGSVAWVLDYEAGLKQAKSSGKPVYLDFSADW